MKLGFITMLSVLFCTVIVISGSGVGKDYRSSDAKKREVAAQARYGA